MEFSKPKSFKDKVVYPGFKKHDVFVEAIAEVPKKVAKKAAPKKEAVKKVAKKKRAKK
jgi:hypothetical protein